MGFLCQTSLAVACLWRISPENNLFLFFGGEASTVSTCAPIWSELPVLPMSSSRPPKNKTENWEGGHFYNQATRTGGYHPNFQKLDLIRGYPPGEFYGSSFPSTLEKFGSPRFRSMWEGFPQSIWQLLTIHRRANTLTLCAIFRHLHAPRSSL